MVMVKLLNYLKLNPKHYLTFDYVYLLQNYNYN